MNARIIAGLGIAAGVLLALAAPAEAAGKVAHRKTRVKGVEVDQYAWTDSQGLKRTVSLKREGGGNPGHGGYAVQMTYEVRDGNKISTVVADDPGGNDGGFGYFVSHERYRQFENGQYGTIAQVVFGTSDSPLGKKFPVEGTVQIGPKARWAAHAFRLGYPRYGTTTPIPWTADGQHVSPTPLDPKKMRLYTLRVTMTWVFEAGTDFPRIDTTVGLADVAKADRVNFDVRAPYGVLTFDDNADKVVRKVMWGDRFHFETTDSPVTRSSDFVWDKPNKGSRYTALIAGDYEMGIYEPRPFENSDTVDGYSNARSKTSAEYACGDFPGQVLPCDWEWPYQSLQYSLPYDSVKVPTTGKKIAWGSAAFYGAGNTLTRSYDTSVTFEELVGFPSSKTLGYSTCIVLGRTIPGGLTRAAAEKNSDYGCATASP
jgi:hypothetical protein